MYKNVAAYSNKIRVRYKFLIIHQHYALELKFNLSNIGRAKNNIKYNFIIHFFMSSIR